ncbi:MAG: clan AA aspartic protease [Elusimicrobiota bacterium]
MGETRIEIEIKGKRKKETVNVLVDTGATLTVISEKILESLGIRKTEEVEVELADGKVVKRFLGEAKITLDSKSLTTRVIFGKKSDTQVLGTVVLEELGLAVDPIRKRIIPVRYLFMKMGTVENKAG